MDNNAPPAGAGRARRPQPGDLARGEIRRWVATGADERPEQFFLKGARDDRTVTYAQLATLASALPTQLTTPGRRPMVR